MTDNEIMKNVRCCADHYCKGCSLQGKPNCKETLLGFAWNTMYNQKAEIEEQHQAILNALKRMGEIRAEAVKATEEKLHPYKLHYGILRMEIAREFADRLKDKKVYSTERHENIVPVAVIDWTVKEMEKECEQKD